LATKIKLLSVIELVITEEKFYVEFYYRPTMRLEIFVVLKNKTINYDGAGIKKT